MPWLAFLGVSAAGLRRAISGRRGKLRLVEPAKVGKRVHGHAHMLRLTYYHEYAWYFIMIDGMFFRFDGMQ